MADVARMELEAGLLMRQFDGVVLELPWLMVPGYSLPSLWTPGTADLALRFSDRYPDQAPYAFYLRPPPTLRNGKAPKNTARCTDPPFGSGEWLKFSWQADPWVPAVEPSAGSNILAFVHSFRARLEEGQ